MRVLVVIPARGGSKGIPRKNLRSLAGKPLIAYSIQTALASKYEPDVYVSSDDEEILSVAAKLGAKTHRRNPAIASDVTTLDPVIHDTYLFAAAAGGNPYDLVVTLQPTSPLLQSQTLDNAISIMAKDSAIATVIAARDDTHLTWRKSGDGFLPNYSERVNRQYLTPTFRETGAFLITRSSIITANNRIGNSVHLSLLEGGECIDIDTFEDWNLCEYFLKRKKVLFVVSGYPEIGLGHVYNTLLLANDMLEHEVQFLVDNKSGLAYEKIASQNYRVQKQSAEDLVEDIVAVRPDLVVNDVLDTEADYVDRLKAAGFRVVNFEDLGAGANRADIVVNAIYPESKTLPNHYFGPDYFVLRDEFVLTPQKVVKDDVCSVLLTFGGVDPANLTQKVLKAIYDDCCRDGIEINVVTGFGYQQHESLQGFEKVNIHRNTRRISDHMAASDLIFTSAGRTVYEVASLGVPAIVLAQNQREKTHFFANEQYGFVNLGLGGDIDVAVIRDEFVHLCENLKLRQMMSLKMKQTDLRGGRQRVQRLIKNILEG